MICTLRFALRNCSWGSTVAWWLVAFSALGNIDLRHERRLCVPVLFISLKGQYIWQCMPLGAIFCVCRFQGTLKSFKVGQSPLFNVADLSGNICIRARSFIYNSIINSVFLPILLGRSHRNGMKWIFWPHITQRIRTMDWWR